MEMEWPNGKVTFPSGSIRLLVVSLSSCGLVIRSLIPQMRMDKKELGQNKSHRDVLS